MKSKSMVQYIIVSLVVAMLVACASGGEVHEESGKKLIKTFGNSENVHVFENPVMALHDIIVTPTADGVKIGGHIHVIQHTRYVPGHIDIAVVDNDTKEVVSVVSTDFNPRIAEYDHRNLTHENNFGIELAGVTADKVTVYVAYHPSNVDRASRFDCGENAALAEWKKMNK
ncbi:MAG: hypothetical protein AMJ55_10615 [Gammaproteobacteria bacterium SG8_15]|nr:MAG: hypothetical protein AMJ55_10615 [Gammaproteobacteria bacterium SG8_15]